MRETEHSINAGTKLLAEVGRHKVHEDANASLIGGGEAPVDLSERFAGVPPADKGRILIASIGEIGPADLPADKG